MDEGSSGTGSSLGHPGKGNILLFPPPSPAGEHDGPMQWRERLGGVLKYSEREAA